MRAYKVSSIALAAAATFAGLTATAAAEELVFTSWGGAYQKAIHDAWIAPFTKETGVTVLEETGPQTAKIKAMVDTGTITWDVVTDGGTGVVRGAKLGLFEEITKDMVDQSHIYPEVANPYGVPSEVFSTAFAFSTEAFPDGAPQPTSWADFWDVEKFPGMRSLRNKPGTIIEAALMADGVPAGDVYKVLATKAGQDRAFAKIEALKPHVAVWWSSGAQPAQVLGSGEVVMANGWNGRLQAGIKEGLPMRIVWNGAVAEVGYFMIVKGAKNRDAAIKFLDWMVSPTAQAEFHKYVSYGPVTPQAWDHIPKDMWGQLPSSPENLGQSIFLDVDWWIENETAMVERYQALIQE